MENIFVEDMEYSNSYMHSLRHNRSYIFTVIAGNVSIKDNIENLLNDCVALNTYSDYFTSKTGFESIQIVCGMKCYDSCFEMSLNCKKDILERQVQFNAPLVIDELVKINTSAEKDLEDIFPQSGFYSYDYKLTQLKKILTN